MIMPPDLEERVRRRLGDGMFRELRDRPLIAVALAAERMIEAGERVPDDFLRSWVVFLAAKRDELARSEQALAMLVDDREDVREFARTRLAGGSCAAGLRRG